MGINDFKGHADDASFVEKVEKKNPPDHVHIIIASKSGIGRRTHVSEYVLHGNGTYKAVRW